MKTLLLILFITMSVNSFSQSTEGKRNDTCKVSHLMNVNFGSANYFAIGYTYENNRKVKWLADIQGTDEMGLQLCAGYRIGTEMYNISPMAGDTQFFMLERDDKKGFYKESNSFTASVRAQVWILNFQVTKRVKQKTIFSIGLRGNILK